MDSAPEAAADHSKDSTRVPSTDTSHPDRAVSTGSDTLLDLEPPRDSNGGVSMDENAEETTLLTGGSPEVSAVKSISQEEEEDHLLSSSLQRSTDEIVPITEDSTPVSGSSQAELTGSSPKGSGDHPIITPPTVETSEGTMDSAPTVEHQAKVHSNALGAGADAEASAAAWGEVFIKLELLDPKPVTFMGNWVLLMTSWRLLTLCWLMMFPRWVDK